MFAVFTVATVAWRVFDAWSNLEFIGQKAGLLWRVLHFFIATQAGANTLVIVFVALLVGSLLFQFERTRPELLATPDPPLALTVPSVTAAANSAVKKTKEQAAPNLVDRGFGFVRAHQDIWSQLLVEGAADRQYAGFDPDWEVLVIEICNEFRVDPKTVSVENLTAEITYTLPDGTNFKFNRGAWLNGRNRTGLNVNDSRHLIVALSQMKYGPRQICIFTKEYPHARFIYLDSILANLPHGHDYPLEIALISESKGERYGTLNYILAVDKDGTVDFIKASEWDAFQEARTAAVEEPTEDA